ncbi:class II fructose-bisphosphatase [Wolbachia endosymbiont of Pentidionis agamae]|uniref:class II fructose-bisphosphatase n=1 Tax=Wolbachia endosymbiont of Pentidionis agamae TaxID=3110435 RepID=UPI0038CD3275
MIEDLACKLIKVTEAAALSAYKFAGLGDEKEADRAAVNSMRKTLNSLEIDGTIVIGEGERDEAPMLYIGEKVGTGNGVKLDIAVDPLEGTTLCAHFRQGAMSTLAVAAQGNFLHAPDIYMEKIAVGKNLPKRIVSLKNSIEENLSNLAKAKNRKVDELVVSILKRDRHNELISRIRRCGVRIKLIDDGDIVSVVSLINDNHDMYIGIGGAPEGIIAAAALSSIGGQMDGKLIFDTDESRKRAKDFNIYDIDRIYSIEDMVRGESAFITTGITDGELVDGIKYDKKSWYTDSLIVLPGEVKHIKNRIYKVR